MEQDSRAQEEASGEAYGASQGGEIILQHSHLKELPELPEATQV
jgi:hypothetical protein